MILITSSNQLCHLLPYQLVPWPPNLAWNMYIPLLTNLHFQFVLASQILFNCTKYIVEAYSKEVVLGLCNLMICCHIPKWNRRRGNWDHFRSDLRTYIQWECKDCMTKLVKKYFGPNISLLITIAMQYCKIMINRRYVYVGDSSCVDGNI